MSDETPLEQLSRLGQVQIERIPDMPLLQRWGHYVVGLQYRDRPQVSLYVCAYSVEEGLKKLLAGAGERDGH
jgi:hypothetical protein